MDKAKAVVYALLAAAFYAINVPVSKLLLNHVGLTSMAALLYLGAGLGIGIMSLGSRQRGEKLSRKDLPFVIGMIVLDIAAPIFLMLGISYGSSSNASLLGNFEIVATTVIALLLFKEVVTKRLWGANALITASSILLSFEGSESFRFSLGSLFVLLATVCWDFENNCTRNISSKSTYEIVIIKGKLHYVFDTDCSGIMTRARFSGKKGSFEPSCEVNRNMLKSGVDPAILLHRYKSKIEKNKIWKN